MIGPIGVTIPALGSSRAPRDGRRRFAALLAFRQPALGYPKRREDFLEFGTWYRSSRFVRVAPARLGARFDLDPRLSAARGLIAANARGRCSSFPGAGVSANFSNLLAVFSELEASPNQEDAGSGATSSTQ